MSSLNGESYVPVTLLAVALADEESFWLAAPRSNKPLADDWKNTKCNWLYPMQGPLSRFENVSGFELTDSVFEIELDAVSTVQRFATLWSEVEGKKVKVGKRYYVFVPQDQMEMVELRYQAVLKREAEEPLLPAAASKRATVPVVQQAEAEPAKEGQHAHEEEREIKEEEKHDEDEELNEEEKGKVAVQETRKCKVDEYRDSDDQLIMEMHSSLEMATDESTDDDDGDSSRGVRTSTRQRRPPSSVFGARHERTRPLDPNVSNIYVAPELKKPTGSHASSEAFSWEQRFIVHRGAADFLCAHATGNHYGFRLDRVTRAGVPVFFLFWSATNNSCPVEPNANGVPVFESAVLSGEGGQMTGATRVLIMTRKAGPKKRKGGPDGLDVNGEEARVKALERRRRQRRQLRERRGRYRGEADDSSDSSDDYDDVFSSSSDEEDGGYFGEPRHQPRTRARKETVEFAGESEGAGTAAAEVRAYHSGPRDRRKTKQPRKEDRPALQAVSVNLWAEPERVLPTASQLSKQFTFAHDPTSSLRTVVFSDGTCVTYSPASAAKVVHETEKKPHKTQQGGSGSASTSVSGGNPADADMRGLLEHIQLAKEQVKHPL